MINLEWRKITIIILSYLAIFALAKLFHSRFPARVELSRKISHFCGGILSLFLPFVFTSHWSVLFLSIVFIAYLLLMKKMRGMKAVYSVKRKSYGVVLFPVAVYILFFISSDRPAYYIISLLTLTVADTAAALIGTRYGRLRFDIDGNKKSVEGTIAFFLVTFLCVNIPLLLMTEVGSLQSLIVAFIIAAAVTGFELISLVGTDNLFIPVGTYYIINRILNYPFAITINTLIQLFVSVISIVLCFGWIRAVRLSWMITMMLFNFACLTLCGYPPWVVPLVIFEACLLIVLVLIGRVHRNMKIPRRYDIIAALYMVFFPVIFLFVAAFTEDYDTLNPYFIIVLGVHIVFMVTDYRMTAGTAGGAGPVAAVAVSAVAITAMLYFGTVLFTGREISLFTFARFAAAMLGASLMYGIGGTKKMPRLLPPDDGGNRMKLLSSATGVLIFYIGSLTGY